MSRKSKVNQLDVVVLIHDDIFQLDVPVSDTLFMHILENLKQLLNQSLGFILLKGLVKFCLPWNSSLLLQEIMQVLSLHILHDYIHMMISLEGFQKFDDIFVLHLLHQLDFSCDTQSSILINQL